MAQSTQSSAPKKHGGRRAGAGRKPAGYTSPTALTELDRRALLAETPPLTIESVAQVHARSSIASLAKRLEFGSSDAARVAAAGVILDRGYGKPSVDIGGGTEPSVAMTGVPAEMCSEARKFARLAIEVLRRIAEFGTSETVSVSAANALLNRGLGTVAPAKMPDEVTRGTGKREQAVEDAHKAATGVFASPPAPRGLQ